MKAFHLLDYKLFKATKWLDKATKWLDKATKWLDKATKWLDKATKWLDKATNKYLLLLSLLQYTIIYRDNYEQRYFEKIFLFNKFVR